MNIEQFMRRSHMISEHLDKILMQREKLSWVGTPGLANPKFRQVCTAQERLLNAMEDMLDEHSR